MTDMTPTACVEAWNQEHPKPGVKVMYCDIWAKTKDMAFINANGEARIMIEWGKHMDIVPLDDVVVL